MINLADSERVGVFYEFRGLSPENGNPLFFVNTESCFPIDFPSPANGYTYKEHVVKYLNAPLDEWDYLPKKISSLENMLDKIYREAVKVEGKPIKLEIFNILSSDGPLMLRMSIKSKVIRSGVAHIRRKVYWQKDKPVWHK